MSFTLMKDNFHSVSIKGRYLYCYLCLRKVISKQSIAPIPSFLDDILKSFTISTPLDIWQDSADDIMPSRLLDHKNDAEEFKAISNIQATILREYYSKSKLVTDVIENLIWLGISNLYGGFNSRLTFEYVMDIIDLLKDNQIDLPEFSIISSYSVKERGGCGNLINIDAFY